jgi:ABC-type multidrug transport system fused ATPase/permease subunit
MRDVSSTLLQQSCETACLGDIIAKLPAGLDTIIGERGYTLSGGERQRVGIARALCRNASILLMDEATSALDSTTEHQVMERLMREHRNDHTIIIVAHRTSTLKSADKILVLNGGRIIEQGDFRGLSEDPESQFGMMCTIQST